MIDENSLENMVSMSLNSINSTFDQIKIRGRPKSGTEVNQKGVGWGSLHSTEVAFALLTQLAVVRIPALLRFFLLNCFVRGQHWESLNPSSAIATDFVQTVSDKGLS